MSNTALRYDGTKISLVVNGVVAEGLRVTTIDNEYRDISEPGDQWRTLEVAGKTRLTLEYEKGAVKLETTDA